MQIDWWTLALQAANFLILVWLLWRFLFRPVRAVIEKRRQSTEQAFAEAESRVRDVEATRQRLEADRSQMAKERQEMLTHVHDELEAERRETLQQAKLEAEKLLQAARGAIAEERNAALRELQEHVAGLAVEVAETLLKNACADGMTGVFVMQLERRLKALPAEELARLRQDLEAEGCRLTVVTATAIEPAERQEWRHRLGDILGCLEKTDFATEPAILGGAELRFPHATLSFTWAEQLNKAKELLRGDDAAS